MYELPTELFPNIFGTRSTEKHLDELRHYSTLPKYSFTLMRSKFANKKRKEVCEYYLRYFMDHKKTFNIE